MEKFILDFIEQLQHASDILLYFILFVSAIMENLFPPLPGDTITAFGAFLVGTGRLSYLLVFLATTSGSVIGFLGLFLFGKFLGREFFLEKNYRHLPAENIIAAEKWFFKYGHIIILINRFLPGFRSVISIVAGVSMLPVFKVFIYSLISASLWNLIWIQAGFVMGTKWELVKLKIEDMMRTYNIAVAIILSTCIIIFVIYRIYKRRSTVK